MPRTKSPQNKIAEDLKPHVQEARNRMGLPDGRGYIKRSDDGKSLQRISYGVKYQGEPPHYALPDEKPGEQLVFDDVWKAIFLAGGASGKAELSVLVKTVKTTDDGDKISTTKV